MKTIETHAGDDLYSVLSKAVDQAHAKFNFNAWTFETRAGETLGDARQRFKDENNFEVLTPEESSARAIKKLEEMQSRQKTAIADAKVPTESEMRQSKASTPNTVEELAAYVQAMVDRPHDYGTCAYAMSYAAVAAFNFVARKLGVTGFQASCADMDILRQTRNWEWGRILDYSNLLYPQYCDEYHFPTVKKLLADPEIASRLAKMARAKLAENGHAHKAVSRHWQKLADFAAPACQNPTG